MQHYEQRTGDHAIPVSWYPDAVPPDLEKWQAPACLGCNGKLGEVENRILQDFRLALDPNSVEASGVANKAIKAIDPDQAKTPRDRGAREKAREHLFTRLEAASELPMEDLSGVSLSEVPASDSASAFIGPSAADLDLVISKIARGLVWALCDERFIEETHRIEVQPARSADSDRASQRWRWYLHTQGRIHERGPGVVVRIVVQPTTDKIALELTLWRASTFLVFVSPCSEQALLTDYETVEPETWMS